MEVQCSKCGEVTVLEVPEEAQGKKIKFNCKNKQCRERIEIRIPKKRIDDKSTFVTPSKAKNILSATLDVIPNELTPFARFELKKGLITVGRKSKVVKADIQVDTDDSDMSRLHFSINCIKDALGTISFILKDESSKNGLSLNGEKLQTDEEIYLIAGDVLKAGNTSFLFVPEYKS
jgi:pSer/pThr/pTyr-binding forkhead associated (FHA) protein